MKKIFIWVALIAVVGGLAAYRVLATRNKAKYKIAYTAARQDIKQTVLATGTVTSQSNLSLSFKSSGILKVLNVKVGDQVKAGQTLAVLDQKDANAVISQAQASLMSAQANYDKVVSGVLKEDVAVSKAAVQSAEVALNNAKSSYNNAKSAYNITVQQQQTLVANAYSAMLNSGLSALPAPTNSSTAAVTVTGTYTATSQGAYKITVGLGSGGYIWSLSGLESSDYYFVARGAAQPMGAKGLYINFSATGSLSPNDFWTVPIPNTQAAAYLANYNAYQSALQTQTQVLASAQTAVDAAQAGVDSAQAALDSAKAALVLKQVPARPEDVKAAAAQVATAHANLQSAQNTYLNNIITAPISGQITAVAPKLGENVTALKEAVVLLDQNSLHIESNVPESSIALLKPGQKSDITFDAFGPDKHFSGNVLSIDPASTVVSGVINYRIVSSAPLDSAIKPGMTANLVITINEIQGALAVPNRLIKTIDGKKYVSVGDERNSRDAQVEIGFVGDSYTEIKSGLEAGQRLVLPVNNK